MADGDSRLYSRPLRVRASNPTYTTFIIIDKISDNVCELLQNLISAKPLPPQSGTSVEKFLSDIEQQPPLASQDPFYMSGIYQWFVELWA